MKILIKFLAVAVLSSMGLSPLSAEDVEEQIATALSAYKAGNYSEAISALDYASQQVRQRKAESLLKFLPEAPTGWEAEEAKDDSMGNSLLGGMVQTRRSYRKDESTVSVQFQSDSALLQSFAMMMNNPMILGASGAKLETIRGQKCAFEFSGRQGSIKTLVDGRYFVEISGSEVTRDVLLTFAKAIDYAKLAGMK